MMSCIGFHKFAGEKEKKRERWKYKNLNISRTKRAF